MNEAVLLKLKVIVERAVRPVKATTPRKRQLREELLGHVTAVFDEELSRCGDEAAALVQAEKRFGDPIELARKLQESVSLRDRYSFYCERRLGPRPGESLLKRAVRHGFSAFVVEVCAMAVMSPLFPFFWKSHEIGIFIPLGILISIGCGGMMFTTTLLINGLERALFRGIGQSRFKACFLIVASCIAPVLLYLSFIFAVNVFVSDDYKAVDLANIWRIVSASVLFASIVIWLTRQLSSDNRYREEWSQLQID